MENPQILSITPDNVLEETFFCVKDPLNPGFTHKKKWFEDRYEEGLKMKILKEEGKLAGFIEYVPGEFAWRPVRATGYLFIQCMYVYPNKNKNRGLGSLLLQACEQDAKEMKLSGVAAMTSEGSWMTDKRLFEKNGYDEVDKRERFELMAKVFDHTCPVPSLIDWTRQRERYDGWYLLYADQCPWHEKASKILQDTAKDYGIYLKVEKLHTAHQAQEAPSGFGVFSLLRDGKLIEDHYISQTRFKNILKKELAV